MFNESGLYIGIFLILAGLLNCFFGYKLFKFLLGVVGFIIGGYMSGRFVYSITQNEMASIIAGVIFGIVIAFISIFFYYGGVFIIGASLGAIIAYLINFSVDPMLKIALFVVFIVAGGVLALVFQKLMIIISSSFGGSYLLVNGVLYCYLLMSSKHLGIGKYFSFVQKNSSFYITVLVSSLIVGVLGIIVQYRSDNKM